MNFNQLKYFITLIREGSFTLAAERLEISQPALSIQIKALEEELEFRLIDRTRKPLELTAEGEVFLSRAREIVQLTDQLKDISLEMSMADEGFLRLGIIPTVAPYLVPLFIGKFNSKYPKIRLEVTEMVTEEIIAELKNGNLDAGIVATPLEAGPIVFTPLFFEQFFLYVSENHPLFEAEEILLDDFDPKELWFLREGNCFQNQVADFCMLSKRERAEQPFSYHSNSIESLRRMVELQGGMTFLPELATINIPADYEDLVKPIAGPVPYREISIAVNRIHIRERLLLRLTETIRASLPPRMLSRPGEKIVSPGIRIG